LHPPPPEPSEKLALTVSPNKPGRMTVAMGEVDILSIYKEQHKGSHLHYVTTPFSPAPMGQVYSQMLYSGTFSINCCITADAEH